MSEEKKPIEPHPHKTARTLEFCRCGAYRIDGGPWRPAAADAWAVVRAVKSVAMMTAPQLRRRATKAGKERWRRKSPQQRSDYMKWVAEQPRPERRKPSCPCGEMTLERAAKRKHVCTADMKPLFGERIKPTRRPKGSIPKKEPMARRPPEPFENMPGRDETND